MHVRGAVHGFIASQSWAHVRCGNVPQQTRPAPQCCSSQLCPTSMGPVATHAGVPFESTTVHVSVGSAQAVKSMHDGLSTHTGTARVGSSCSVSMSQNAGGVADASGS